MSAIPCARVLLRRLRVVAGFLALAFGVGCAGDDPPAPVVAPVVIDTGAVPTAAVGETFTYTFRATGGSGTYTWSVESGSAPAGLTLSTAGVLAGVPTTVQQQSFVVRATSGERHATRAVALDVTDPPVVFVTTSVPTATWGRAYFALLQASGGSPGTSTTWSLSSGALPTGVALAASGSLVGIPTTLGPHLVRLRSTRGTRSAELDFQLRVDAPALVMETAVLPDARAGQPYVVNLLASGGIGGYSWRLATGVLPSGLTFTSDGTIAGTPVAEDSIALSIELTSGAQQVVRAFGLLVEPVTYPATGLVTMPGDVFAPFIVRVRPGGAVTWRFGASPHNVIFAATPGAPSNIDIVSSVDVTRVFPVPGSFRYDCTIHPGMAGRVEVR